MGWLGLIVAVVVAVVVAMVVVVVEVEVVVVVVVVVFVDCDPGSGSESGFLGGIARDSSSTGWNRTGHNVVLMRGGDRDRDKGHGSLNVTHLN